MTDTRLRYSNITYNSLVNGPGVRNVLHLQGCTIGCKGCFNTHTWSHAKGKVDSVYRLAFEVMKDNPEGLTVSGGEPTEQWPAVKRLLEECHKRNGTLDVLMFTGLTEDQLETSGILKEAFERCHESPALVSTIVCGPYDRTQPIDSYLLGSANQKILTWNGEALSGEGPRVEIQVEKDGSITVTGFPNGDVVKYIKKNFKQEK